MKNMVRFLPFFLCIILLSCKEASTVYPPTVIDGKLNWLTMSEADNISSKSGKKYLVDVYTDWCGWCKVMDKKTFTDPKVIAFLEENFHVIKFNAEGKEPIRFNGKTWEWIPRGRNGVNKLAVDMLGGRMSYPSIVFLDENKEKISVSVGYKDAKKLMKTLKSI